MSKYGLVFLQTQLDYKCIEFSYPLLANVMLTIENFLVICQHCFGRLVKYLFLQWLHPFLNFITKITSKPSVKSKNVAALFHLLIHVKIHCMIRVCLDRSSGLRLKDMYISAAWDLYLITLLSLFTFN